MSSGGSSNPLPISPLRTGSLPIIAPISPASSVCNGLFGVDMITAHCLSAGSQLPVSDNLMPYSVGVGESSYDLPWERTYG